MAREGEKESREKADRVGEHVESALPEAPTIMRRMALSPIQWTLLAFLVTLPLLGLAGIFERYGRVEVRSRNLHVEAETPLTARYQAGARLRLRLRNAGGIPIESVLVRFDSAYMERFDALSFHPEIEVPYVVQLTPLDSGMVRLVRVELKGADLGRHRGSIRITSNHGDTASIALQTIVLP